MSSRISAASSLLGLYVFEEVCLLGRTADFGEFKFSDDVGRVADVSLVDDNVSDLVGPSYGLQAEGQCVH